MCARAHAHSFVGPLQVRELAMLPLIIKLLYSDDKGWALLAALARADGALCASWPAIVLQALRALRRLAEEPVSYEII